MSLGIYNPPFHETGPESLDLTPPSWVDDRCWTQVAT